MQIEVRIKATNSNILRGDYDESQSVDIELETINAEVILNILYDSGFITTYAQNNGVGIVINKKPMLRSEIDRSGEFAFTIPQEGYGQSQRFRARVVFEEN